MGPACQWQQQHDSLACTTSGPFSCAHGVRAACREQLQKSDEHRHAMGETIRTLRREFEGVKQRLAEADPQLVPALAGLSLGSMATPSSAAPTGAQPGLAGAGGGGRARVYSVHVCGRTRPMRFLYEAARVRMLVGECAVRCTFYRGGIGGACRCPPPPRPSPGPKPVKVHARFNAAERLVRPAAGCAHGARSATPFAAMCRLLVLLVVGAGTPSRAP